MSTTLDLIRQAEVLISSVDGLPPEEMDAAMAAWVSGAGDKAAALQAVIARAESEEAFLKREADALSAAAKAHGRVVERCRHMLVGLLRAKMALGEGTNIKGPGWSMGLRETQAVEVSDPTALPA